MDTQHPSAPPHAHTRGAGKNHPRRPTRANTHPSGVTHDNTRHTTRFTVIGNHLAQHPELSALAIGLAVHTIEAQGKKDPAKPASWAYYASYLLTKYRLQPMLLVVCQDRATVEWAAREVRFGPRQWPLLTLRPLVAGPHNMPVITDPAEVRKDLAVATLSAITHATHPKVEAILKAMTHVLRDTPTALVNPIVELIAQGMGQHPAAELWRKLVAVDLSFYKSYISEEIRDEGRAEGRAEDILDAFDVRGIDVPEAVRERITGCHDPETLRRWHRRAVIAPSADEIFTDE